MPDPISTIVGGSLIGGAASIYGSNKAAKSADKAAQLSTEEQRRQFDLLRQDQAPYRALGNAALDRIGQLYGYGPLSAAQPQGAAQYDPQTNWLAGIPSGAGGIYGGFLGQIGTQARTGQAPSGVNALAAPQAGTGRPDMSVFFESPDYQFNLAEGQKAIDRSLAARGRALSGAGVREGVRYASGMASNEYGNFYNRLASQAGIGQSSVQSTGAAGMQAAANIGNALMQAGNTRANAYMQGAEGVNNAVQGGLGNWLWGKGRGLY